MALVALAGCSDETRDVGPNVPQTAPVGNADPRVRDYQSNLYHVSQGGRYFAWYGCTACHGESTSGQANLVDGRWWHGGGFADVYRAIAMHRPEPSYGNIIPAEQIWEITAYVRDLPMHHSEKRRRVMLDQTSEAQGSQWSGPK